MTSLYVLGTDTDVGKTVVSAGLLAASPRSTRYWKPVQTGGDDAAEVRRLSGVQPERVLPPVYSFEYALSPHLAAEKSNVIIDEKRLEEAKRDAESTSCLMEAAGGLYVPFSRSWLQWDWLRRWKIPAVLVARDRVGAINHTLLTLSACREAGIRIALVVLNRRTKDVGNREAIAAFGKVDVEVIDEKESAEEVVRLIKESAWAGRLFT